MSSLKRNRVAIIEPSPALQLGLKTILEANADLCVIGTYTDLQSFHDNKADADFDIILINPACINFYKQFVVRHLFPDHPKAILVAILYGYVDSETLNSFAGVLDIYDDGPKMVKKLKTITKACHNQQSTNAESIDLSEREKEILVSVAKGLANKEIADKHCISIHTVISHRKNITRKTGIKTVSGLTLYALFNNLSTQEDLQ